MPAAGIVVALMIIGIGWIAVATVLAVSLRAEPESHRWTSGRPNEVPRTIDNRLDFKPSHGMNR